MMNRRHLLQSAAAVSLLGPALAHAQVGLRWEKRPGKAIQIAIGARGDIFALGANPVPGGFPVFQWVTDRWLRETGGLMTLAVDGQGMPWGTNDQQRIFRMQGGKWQTLPGKAEQIAIGGNGTVFALGARGPQDVDSDVFEWGGGSWTKIAGARGTRLAVDEQDLPWVLKGSGEILRHNSGSWVSVPGRAQDIAIGARGGAWAIGHDGRGRGGFGIYRLNGRAWDRVDGAATSVAVSPKGLPWVVTTEGDIFERV